MSDLPVFERPPLVETATSVQFRPISKLGSAWLGLFWGSALKREFPTVRDVEPLSPVYELFAEESGEPPQFPVFRVAGPVPARLQAVSADEHLMVQIQNGRFVLNWRRLGTDKAYPRWDSTFSRFRAVFAEFRAFLAEHSLGAPLVDQWEVVYVNHLAKGVEWESMSDWPALVPALVGHHIQVDQLSMEQRGASARFELVPRAGRLHIDLKHGRRSTTDAEPEVLVLQLTARGRPEDTGDQGWEAGLAAGRSAIVRTFAAITGPEAHARWGRTQ